MARDIVVAEMMLRRCRAYRQDGRSLRDPLDGETPIYDESFRLVSVETGTATPEAGPPDPTLEDDASAQEEPRDPSMPPAPEPPDPSTPPRPQPVSPSG
jgi:hypothetical protein